MCASRGDATNTLPYRAAILCRKTRHNLCNACQKLSEPKNEIGLTSHMRYLSVETHIRKNTLECDSSLQVSSSPRNLLANLSQQHPRGHLSQPLRPPTISSFILAAAAAEFTPKLLNCDTPLSYTVQHAGNCMQLIQEHKARHPSHPLLR
jgi:hypothetical protein